ncbi:aromatic acid exporter family protein [Anaerobacillus sp. MEB173]|uniref:aromatic acid exporter family protein n=1 Tax=Anaerobacillus sp. MEB173 TaxID=3383345 RepID=UPI003F92975A
MFKIGYRTIKTAVGTAISIAIAQWLDLQFYVSAGILTILCIQVTKQRSLQISGERFLACVIGMIFAIVFFEILGYHPLVLGVLLLLFIPTMVMFKAKEGIVTAIVIILHFYVLQEVSTGIVVNELKLIVIGIGVALLVNLYMPSVEKELKKDRILLERNFNEIFKQVAIYLRNGESDWNGEEITETAHLIEKAKNTALRNIENHFLRYEDKYYHYFKMREKQFEIIERVMPVISSLDETVIQGERIASFLEELCQNIHPGNNTEQLLQSLYEMKGEFKEMELPKDRREFEIRSALFYFVNEMEQYLFVQYQYKKGK